MDELERLRKANHDLAECLEQVAWSLESTHQELKFYTDRALASLERNQEWARRVLKECFPPDGEP